MQREDRVMQIHQKNPIVSLNNATGTMLSGIEQSKNPPLKETSFKENFAKIMPTETKKQMAAEQAQKSAQDILKAFYTQILKSLFVDSEFSKDGLLSSDYESSMIKEMLAEQMSTELGKKVTPTHAKIAGFLMKSQNQEGQIPATENSEVQNPGGGAMHVYA